MNTTMTIRAFLQGVLLAACTLAVSLPAQAAPGNLIKTTTTMKMSGMGGMAPRTLSNTICESAKKPDLRKMLNTQKDMDCKITKFEHSGNKYNYHMACTGDVDMISDGSFTLTADGGYTGKSHSTETTGGHSMTMDMSYVGKRIGSCNYTPPNTP